MDIIHCLQKEVNKIVQKVYANDQYKPRFTVSLLYERKDKERIDSKHQIILTVQHLGSSFSKVIFPQTDNVFGYPDLEEEMKYMYNRTM